MTNFHLDRSADLGVPGWSSNTHSHRFVRFGLKMKDSSPTSLFIVLFPCCYFLSDQGKFYLLIEELSQLFRALVPIQLWYKYIVGEDPSSSYILGAILIIIYSICKVSGQKCCMLTTIKCLQIVPCS